MPYMSNPTTQSLRSYAHTLSPNSTPETTFAKAIFPLPFFGQPLHCRRLPLPPATPFPSQKPHSHPSQFSKHDLHHYSPFFHLSFRRISLYCEPPPSSPDPHSPLHTSNIITLAPSIRHTLSSNSSSLNTAFTTITSSSLVSANSPFLSLQMSPLPPFASSPQSRTLALVNLPDMIFTIFFCSPRCDYWHFIAGAPVLLIGGGFAH